MLFYIGLSKYLIPVIELINACVLVRACQFVNSVFPLQQTHMTCVFKAETVERTGKQISVL